MSRPNSQLPPRFYGGDLEPQGHAAAYIIILLVFAMAGVVVSLATGKLSVPTDLLPHVLASSKPAPILVLSTPTPATALPSPVSMSSGPVAVEDWDVPDGHFFTQTNGQAPRASAKGYAVTNADGIPFWDAFREVGGVDRLGYPVSGRFQWQGVTTQVFQKAAFQWRTENRQVEYVNILDELGAAGKDDFLASQQSIPRPLPPSFDHGKNWDQTVRDRLALLDANPAFKATYYGVSDPLKLYGLPVSTVTDMGNHFALRLQRAVFQQWKEDVPWAKKGQVTLANVGSIAIDAGLFPADAVQPQEPPAGTAPAVAGGASLITPAATASPAPTAQPLAQATPAASFLQVGNTDRAGVYLRRTPHLDDKLVAWPDNARMVDLKEETQAESIKWRKVQDPAGNVGWIPSQYLVPAR